jgi:uncharacterized protein YjbI with pentapeptide repeats
MYDEISIAELLEAYEQGQRVFRGLEVIGESEFLLLSDVTLRDAEFVKCWFHSATFRRVDLAAAKFQNCNLKCTVFEGCNLESTQWEGCSICSLALVQSNTANVSARRLDAYGALVEGAEEFIEYACANARRQGLMPSAL